MCTTWSRVNNGYLPQAVANYLFSDTKKPRSRYADRHSEIDNSLHGSKNIE
ncbi:unnamed protein product, partial [Nesidiocoris tenuis]